LDRHSGFGRSSGEGIDDMMRKYPNWFFPHLRESGPAADKLSFDQNWFVALTAPRAFVVINGESDRICSPTEVRAPLCAAEPIDALYGATEKIGLHHVKIAEGPVSVALQFRKKSRPSG
jgi:hypothetical protein